MTWAMTHSSLPSQECPNATNPFPQYNSLQPNSEPVELFFFLEGCLVQKGPRVPE